MPIEIRELVIRATVEPGGTETKESKKEPPRHEIVAECVEKVLDVLRLREER